MQVPSEFLIVSLVGNAVLGMLYAASQIEVNWYHRQYLSLIDERIAAIKAERERDGGRR